MFATASVKIWSNSNFLCSVAGCSSGFGLAHQTVGEKTGREHKKGGKTDSKASGKKPLTGIAVLRSK